jgi:hypothetical protein
MSREGLSGLSMIIKLADLGFLSQMCPTMKKSMCRIGGYQICIKSTYLQHVTLYFQV